MAITVPAGVPIFLLAVILMGGFGPMMGFSTSTILWLAAAGLLHFLVGRYGNYRATKAMGAVLTGPVQQGGLIFTLALAVMVLGESLTPLRLIGIVLVVIGPAMSLHQGLSARKAEKAAALASETAVEKVAETQARPVFEPNYVEGYSFAALSAVAQGTSPILVRFALEDQGVAASVAGGLISYAAATVVFGLMLFWPGHLRHVLGVKPVPLRWFVISGVFVGISQMFRYMALALAPVSVVTPIQRLSLLFRIYFARLMSRDHEVLGGQVVLGTVISLVGTLALSVSTEFVLQWVHLPAPIAAIALWHWP